MAIFYESVWEYLFEYPGKASGCIWESFWESPGKTPGKLLATFEQYSNNISSNLRRHHRHRDTPWGNCVEGNRIRENPYRTSLRTTLEGNTKGKFLKEVLNEIDHPSQSREEGATTTTLRNQLDWFLGVP